MEESRFIVPNFGGWAQVTGAMVAYVRFVVDDERLQTLRIQNCGSTSHGCVSTQFCRFHG